jgi:myo-inositol-1(or 4)-monophosphatase
VTGHRPAGAPTPGEDRPDPTELLGLAVDLATRAAALHRDGRRTLLRVAEKTSPFDLVTHIDREVETMIVEALRAARPEDAVLGEEGGERPGPSGVRWIVDPLDGTANYVYGYPAHAVSIGVEIQGTPMLGVVYDTGRDILYTGVSGSGATANGEPIAVTEKEDPATAMVATGFSFDPVRRGRQGEVLARLLPQVRDVRRSGAASIDLCALATGAVDAYYERALAPWDVAGGIVVAEAAGATILLPHHDAYPRVDVVGANPALLARLLPILDQAGFSMADP